MYFKSLKILFPYQKSLYAAFYYCLLTREYNLVNTGYINKVLHSGCSSYFILFILFLFPLILPLASLLPVFLFPRFPFLFLRFPFLVLIATPSELFQSFLDSYRLFVCFFRCRFLLRLLFLFQEIFPLVGFLGFSGLLDNDSRRGTGDQGFEFFYTVLYIYLFRIAVIGLNKI